MNTIMRTAAPRRRRQQALDNAAPPTRRIELRLMPLVNDPSARVWAAAHYLGDQPDPHIVDLFDDHVLPTPFTEATDGREVLEFMQRTRPELEVTLAVDNEELCP